MSDIIAISGAHSQGKSTLIDALEKEFPSSVFCKSFVRELKAQGIEINGEGDVHTQMHVLWGHYRRVFEAKRDKVSPHWFVDRCALDAMAYGLLLDDFNELEPSPYVDVCWNLFDTLLSEYRIIFYLEPELPIIADGIREEDIEYFENVTDMFEILLGGLNTKVVRLKGTVEERVRTIIDNIKI
jgi:nicotinamide riboside kinase